MSQMADTNRRDTRMPDHDPGSYCGLYCGACDVQAVHRRALAEGRTARWEELPLTMQRHLPVPKDTPVVCHGCRSDTVFGGCAKCPIRKCARARGNIGSCPECSRFPCLKLRVVWLVGGFYRRLPHLKATGPNLKRLWRVGTSRWLEEQRQEWTCSHCRTPLTWYTKETHRCPPARPDNL